MERRNERSTNVKEKSRKGKNIGTAERKSKVMK